MPRLRLLPGGRPDGDDPDQSPGPNDPVTRALRDLYAAPTEGYWDSLEARVMAAVRVGRGSTTAVAEWWHTLAAWARPGLAAASVVLVVVAAAAIQARANHVAHARTSQPSALEPLDAELARALDLVGEDPAERRAARDAAELLVDGVSLRRSLPRPEAEPRPAAADDEDEMLRARREATFRYVMP